MRVPRLGSYNRLERRHRLASGQIWIVRRLQTACTEGHWRRLVDQALGVRICEMPVRLA